MKALILAAGFGTRMKPFTNTMPKCLVPVNHIPLVLYNLALLKKHGITDIVINLHHQADKIKSLLKNGKTLGLNIQYSFEPKILGTGGGIKKALRFLDEDTLIINGDIILDVNITLLIAAHKKNNPLVTLGLYEHKDKNKYGLLHFRNNRITSILGKPEPALKDASGMFAGIHVLSKSQSQGLFRAFPAHSFFCIMRHVYMPHLLSGQRLGAHNLKGYFQVCDSLEDVANASEKLKSRNITLSYQKNLEKIWAKLV